MKKTIIVCGHGPGISDAVARKYGKEGWNVAIVARNAERLAAAEKALVADGISAKGFAVDLGKVDAVRALVKDVRAAFGPVAAIHYNAYTGGAGDAGSVALADVEASLAVSVLGLLAATQEALADLKEAKGAVLVTGGGFAYYDPKVDAMATQYGAVALAISKAAQHKTVGLLKASLEKEGIYVGEVVVTGLVKGTAFDHGNATLDPKDIANKFFELHEKRAESSVNFA